MHWPYPTFQDTHRVMNTQLFIYFWFVVFNFSSCFTHIMYIYSYNTISVQSQPMKAMYREIICIH